MQPPALILSYYRNYAFNLCIPTTEKFIRQTSYLDIRMLSVQVKFGLSITYNFIPTTACVLIYIIQNQQPRFQFRIKFYFYAKKKAARTVGICISCAVFCVSSVLTHKTNKSIFLSMLRNTLKRCTRECKARRLENCWFCAKLDHWCRRFSRCTTTTRRVFNVLNVICSLIHLYTLHRNTLLISMKTKWFHGN